MIRPGCGDGTCGLESCGRCGAADEGLFVPVPGKRGPKPAAPPPVLSERLRELRERVEAGLTLEEDAELDRLENERDYLAMARSAPRHEPRSVQRGRTFTVALHGGCPHSATEMACRLRRGCGPQDPLVAWGPHPTTPCPEFYPGGHRFPGAHVAGERKLLVSFHSSAPDPTGELDGEACALHAALAAYGLAMVVRT